jgi:hypothetical protein
LRSISLTNIMRLFERLVNKQEMRLHSNLWSDRTNLHIKKKPVQLMH